MSECKECSNERYIILGCCSGRECGCAGQEVAITNCKECNPLAVTPMSDSLEREYGHLEYIGADQCS